MESKEPKNPYIAGRPVEAQEMFFGRQDVFNFVRRNLIGQYQDNAIVLYGEPRTGKTSVLKQMHHYLGQSHVCVYIDLEGMALDGIGNFLWQTADAIWRALPAEEIRLKRPTFHEFTHEHEPRHHFADVFLKRVEEVLKERRLLLMFDEAMCLQDAVRAGTLEGDIFPYLSHLLQHHPLVNFLFCIGRHPRKVAPEFAQAFRAAQYKEIGFLEQGAAQELIVRPVKGLFQYSQAATNLIYRVTSGHPYFIQLICHSLFNRWQEQQKGRLEAEDVQAVLDEAVEMSRWQMLNTWEGLTVEEKAVLAALTMTITEENKAARQDIERVLEAYGMRLAPGQITLALESLSESDILYPDEPYFFRVDLLRLWIRDHKKIEWVKEDISARVSVAERQAVEHPEEVRRRYLQYVQDGCKWLDFRGIMLVPELFFLPLSAVYVPLHVTAARSEELFKHLALRARAAYLAQELADQEIPLGVRREMADEMRRLAATVERQRVAAVGMLKEHPRLVILGDPGSGKTTFLRDLALTFAEGKEAVKEWLGLDAEGLPILIPIDAYTAALRAEPDLSLTDYLPRYFASHELDLPELSTYFRQELAAGRCLVLLDGLDTVLDSTERVQVARRVETFINRHAGNRFVVTSRIEGYREAPLVGDYLHCTVSDLEIPEIERFARQWSLACETQEADTPERRARAEWQAGRLVEAIKAAPGVRRLAVNPLLLTIIALAHRQGAGLPNQRIELYALCARTLVERWNQVRSLSMRPVGLSMDRTEAMKIFGPLALWMHEEKRGGTVRGEELERELKEQLVVIRGLPEEDAAAAARAFLEMERNQVGLLVERGVNAYGFSHLTFQEYFAARALAMGREQLVDKLREHLHDPRWREVILLTAGQIGIRQTEEEMVTALVQAIADSHSPLEDILQRDLLLTGRCLADDVGVSYRQRGELLNRLLDLWHEAKFGRLRQEATSVLAAMQGTACEFQVVTALLADLNAEDPELREIAADALGQMGKTSEPVLDRLMATLRTDKRLRMRAHAALALSRLNVAPERVARALNDALRRDSEREVHLRAAEALAYIGQENDQAIDLLLSALEDNDGNVRGSAAAALTSLEPQERLVSALLKALRDSRLDVRTNAADILGRLGRRSERVIEGLIEMLRDPREDARISAAMALGQVGDTSERVVRALIERLADDSRVVRKNAAAALGKLGARADNVIAALERALHDEQTGVGAADALGQAGKADLRIARVTESQLQAADWRDRIRAVRRWSAWTERARPAGK